MDDIVGLHTPAIPQELLVLPRMSPACSVVVCLFACLFVGVVVVVVLFVLLVLLVLVVLVALVALAALCCLCDSSCCFSALQPSDYTVFLIFV